MLKILNLRGHKPSKMFTTYHFLLSAVVNNDASELEHSNVCSSPNAVAPYGSCWQPMGGDSVLLVSIGPAGTWALAGDANSPSLFYRYICIHQFYFLW